MDTCAKREPQVIDHELIEKSLEEQGLKGEAGRLAKLEGIPWDEVEKIRLEFMNIIRIDHLWVLPGLTKLSLSNNLIEQIENLETLVNLNELDLSFNKITKIENLETLENLEILTLYENSISKIENLDTLKRLMVFSIGKNLISDRDDVLYFRTFSNLKSLNLAGNPCTDEQDFRLYVATFLPHLIYYEYKMIMEPEREEGCALFRSLLLALQESEGKDKANQHKLDAEDAEGELQPGSFVEFLDSSHLFECLFANDPDGKVLLKIGDEAQDYYNEFEEEFVTCCKQIFEMGQEQYHIRTEEVEQFLMNVDGAKDKSQQESIQHMEVFLSKKREIFDDIKQLAEQVDNRELSPQEYNQIIYEYADTYNAVIHEIWKLLMGSEITLFEQIEEVNSTFEHALTEMVNTFIESAQAIFAQMRTITQNYNENISECSSRYYTNASLIADFYMPKELRGVMVEKEVLTNAVAASHDLHLQVIDNREDRLVSRARAWLFNLVSNLQKDEVVRNRAKVLEINHFLDIQREEFDQLSSLDVGTGMDPDITAALS